MFSKYIPLVLEIHTKIFVDEMAWIITTSWRTGREGENDEGIWGCSMEIKLAVSW